MGPAHLPVPGTEPVQARRMGRRDIDDLRRWHRQGVDRSLRAGYDLVYVYAGHGLTAIQHFLSRRYNDRTDEYGGSIANRARLLREILEDTLEEVDGRAAVACRICVDELIGAAGIERGEIEEVLGIVGELPDVWDFMVGEWDFDSITRGSPTRARRSAYVRGLKALTTKPVVGVGRFTSADTMVRMVRDGVLDMIGSARPSIADPFLPKKIEEGRWEDIRECIGCNICVTGDFTITPLRCTQNPSMGEEWRRGWHPERIRAEGQRRRGCWWSAPGRQGWRRRTGSASAATTWCWPRPTGELGGRVALRVAAARAGGVDPRARLPPKSQLERLGNVELAFDSELTADEIASYELRPRRRGDRRALAGRRRRPLARRARSRSTPACRC